MWSQVRGKAFRHLGDYEKAALDLRKGQQIDYDDDTAVLRKVGDLPCGLFFLEVPEVDLWRCGRWRGFSLAVQLEGGVTCAGILTCTLKAEDTLLLTAYCHLTVAVRGGECQENL